MAGSGDQLSIPVLTRARILIVEARYHAHINDMLLAGVRRMLERARVNRVEHVVVPGALEIPAAIALAPKSYDGFVAIGVVIRGETTHYDTVAYESSRGITDLAVREQRLIGNGILTVENEQQAIVRADPAQMDKGGGAALAALHLIALRDRFRG
ncbi:MAG TPA: 6,7-dimethyl-8-ribityllumazine synthase [Geminicoccus sp.]|uniref:6,7-dimethyl-8-ribityllumazine synthase n=1 Tax=Geminicoccus sp. TaxID=2024832 RepID=UPI002CC23D46|nr:6,7-dimethyl-8-ribityllumazine synthase [Geminicoccus sp.]HWL67921.1 6,7-dimethyl-8-ribityllumazine synthase [Geminicoccus sp.]